MTGKFLRAALVCGLALASSFSSVEAKTRIVGPGYRVLHAFCQSTSCPEGSAPIGDQLAVDVGGNLYGVTGAGSRFNNGAAYQLTRMKDGRVYRKNVLKSFCAPGFCNSGGAPLAGVIIDTAGNLYGTGQPTTESPCGAVYELIPGVKTTIKILHKFQGTPDDGCTPNYGSLTYQGKDSGAAYDGTSPLFGMTRYGGAGGLGVVYEFLPPKPGRKIWGKKILYNFCSGCDVVFPYDNLVMDSAGNLFGTGGTAVFELSPNGNTYDFSEIYVSATDESVNALTITPDGTLFGTALGGGTTDAGTLFKLVPSGGSYIHTQLHTFCSATNCTDGAGALKVAVDANGNIFGTTTNGGANNLPGDSRGAGVFYEYSSGGTFSVLYNFCAQANCTDGGVPSSGPLSDGNGNYFGVTSQGGSTANTPAGAGVAFELRP